MTKKTTIDFSDKTCGYVMPISDTPGYKAGHWEDVKNLLNEITEDLGFKETRIVSSGLVSTTIHKKIVNNLFNDDIIVCDVSSQNPNVMLELGMRIAFDKPVVIIIDDETKFCFDSGVIEHLVYPKDLRYSSIEGFKVQLKAKIKHTLDAYLTNPKISPILQSFGSFDVSNVNLPKMSPEDEFRTEISDMRKMLTQIARSTSSQSSEMKNNFNNQKKKLYGISRNKFYETTPSDINSLLRIFNAEYYDENKDDIIIVATHSELDEINKFLDMRMSNINNNE
ncbi:hypothetical protein [Wohlfahrtiimonas populi]|uniref:hypothetical protein n=1 Tax=Wohlfahrtiimonas populi TaxID=1940240 RepID=UPI00098D5E9C|nr:hypothetical protein [Wohlfahrtiimonas populi]